MNRKNFIVIIVLLVISLVSILFVQFNWIADLNRLNEDRFKKDIQHVLYMINERLEEKEIINLTKDNLQATFKIKRSTESGDIELIESTFNKKTLDSSDVLNSDNSLQFDIESGGSKDGEVNSNVNASIQIENLQSLNLDSSMQTQINKILDRSEMIQIILNKLLTNDRTITSDINKDFLNKIMPLTILTAIAFIICLFVLQKYYSLNDAILKVIFIGLASLTFPHILLEYLIEKNEK